MTSIDVQELIEIILYQPKVAAHLSACDIASYLKLMRIHNIGHNIKISTYDDYLKEIQPTLSKFKPYIGESKYNILLLFRSQMDSLVFDILFK